MRAKNTIKLPVPTEHVEQVRFCMWLKQMNIYYAAVPNGARTSWSQAKKLKSEGMSAGFPDIVIVTNPIIFVEMKRQRGGVQSEEQKLWQKRIENLGHWYVLGKGSQDAIKQVEVLLNVVKR